MNGQTRSHIKPGMTVLLISSLVPTLRVGTARVATLSVATRPD
jgi:hypothetical protein